MLRKQFLETRRGRVAEILRRGPATVERLAVALRITPSAVRALLTAMERDGLVRRAGLVPGATRPASAFEPTPALEHLLSGAYIPLLTHLVHTFAAGLDRDRFHTLMRQTGQSLAAEAAGGKALRGTLETRVRHASAFLNAELGAVTQVVRRNGSVAIEGQGCPLAAITDREPAVCIEIESLLHHLVQAPVHECCDRAGRPRCCFTFQKSSQR